MDAFFFIYSLGRYHIDKCPVLQNSRETARNHGARLTSVSGIPVHPDVFKSARRPRPKVAKIPGFVMSHSVSIDDPRRALTEEELDAGEKRGRKGYVRCLRCNSEVFAPNARYHASHCETETHLWHISWHLFEILKTFETNSSLTRLFSAWKSKHLVLTVIDPWILFPT